MSTTGYNTPSLVSYKLCFDQSPATEAENVDISHVPYAYLLWCAVDQTLHKHWEYMSNLCEDHWAAVKWILHYLLRWSEYRLGWLYGCRFCRRL